MELGELVDIKAVLSSGRTREERGETHERIRSAKDKQETERGE